MKIEKEPRYLRDVKNLTKRKILSLRQIEETEKLFSQDPFHKSLRYHKIICKKDKFRYSVTIINTSFRILLSNYKDIAYFRSIHNHDQYDRMNKDC